MIWAAGAAALLAGGAAWPLLRERLRAPMDGAARSTAPGAFAELPSGCTHYRWIGPRRGPVAVCVHGLTTPSCVWDGLADGLAAAGCRVLVYDLYGRGFSDRPEGVQDRGFFLAQLEELLAHQGIGGDILLAGYSMGGAIATAFAVRHPGRVRQLILLAPAGLAPPSGRLAGFIRQTPVFGDWLMLALFPHLHRRAIAAERPQTGARPEIAAQQRRELRFRGFVPAVLAALRGILSEDFSEDHRILHRAGVPVLAVWGGGDRVVPVSAMGRLAELSRAARQAVVEGAGHGLPYTHSAEVLAAIYESRRDGLI